MNDMSVGLTNPDLTGEFYISTLQRLHEGLQPKTYFEIGTLRGDSLAVARCASIAVDPAFHVEAETLEGVFSKPRMLFYQMGSDDFFAQHSPSALLGAPIDMAFLDGMHRCEYLLRDFLNTERHCKRNSIVALHDCLPIEPGITTRLQHETSTVAPHRTGWWSGDVWRTSLLLRRMRPDLSMTVLDCVPTGLVLITNLNPASTYLADNYAELVRTMLSWDLETIGIADLFAEMQVESAGSVLAHEQMTQRFWL